MSLNSSLSIASGGLANINAQLALISQNVANAATPGYAVEVGSQQSMTADGVGMGVQTGPATLQIDQALQTSVTQQNATVSGLQMTQTSLQAIDSVLGTPGSGNDIGSLVGKLQDSFTTLLTDPSNQSNQTAVVASAKTLAQGINSLSDAYSAQRQGAQSNIESSVTVLNSTLATIGQLSDQIIALKPTDLGTADLQNQRNAAVQTLSQLLDVKTIPQANGDLLLFTASGQSLPTHGSTNQFSVANSTVATGSFYPGGGIAGIMLNGTDVTKQLTGGQIGADITLRDTTLPTSQAELDEFSQGVSSRFAAQGLTLFTDSTGAAPTSGGTPTQAGYVGYASTIQVNPAVTADPTLVRDGTGSATAATGFTVNPVGGPSGFTSLISNVVSYTFGTRSSSTTQQWNMSTTGLGAAGNLAAPFSASGETLAGFATSLVSSQSQASAAVTSSLSTEQALQGSLSAKATSISGVNMDSELSSMLTLQNAYGANAKIISTVQSMFTQLLQAVS
jgi:flagellar hook-associated protein 1 FlgK